ncbi:hypothetical protein ACFL5U_01755, partial [Candidatus Margulisiibacteriota bacterium]
HLKQLRQGIFKQAREKYLQDVNAFKPQSSHDKLTKLNDQLLGLLQDFRITKLAEQENGVIDFIQQLLTTEQNSVLYLERKAEDNPQDQALQQAHEAARKAYLDRLETFRGTIRIAVDKKHLRLFNYTNIMVNNYSNSMRPPQGTRKQRKEMTSYFHHIGDLFEETLGKGAAN